MIAIIKILNEKSTRGRCLIIYPVKGNFYQLTTGCLK